jgi:hypothetical protein
LKKSIKNLGRTKGDFDRVGEDLIRFGPFRTLFESPVAAGLSSFYAIFTARACEPTMSRHSYFSRDCRLPFGKTISA